MNRTSSNSPTPLDGLGYQPAADAAAPADPPARSGWRGLTIILLAGLVLRLALLPFWSDLPAPGAMLAIADENDYDGLASSLITTGEFALRPGRDRCSSRPPGYPAFLAAVYQVAGDKNFQAVRIVQCALGLLLVIEVFYLARGMYGTSVALWAAGITSFYPSLVGFQYLILGEILFTVVLLASLLALQSHWRRAAWWKLAWFGILFGLATLVRSVLWPFVPFLLIGVYASERNQPRSRRLLSAAVATAAFLLTLAPWAIRNTQLERAFVPVDTLGGRNMMMGNYEHTPLYRTWAAIGVRGPKAWDQVLASEHEDYYTLTQGQRDKLAMKRGIEFVLANPGLTAKRDIVKFFNFWQLERTLVAGLMEGRWGAVPKSTVLGIGGLIAASYAATLLLGVFGFLVVPPDDRRMHWWILLLIGFVCAVHTVVFAHERYHLSLMPLVFVYTGTALVHWRTIWQRRWTLPFNIALAVSLVLGASWVFEVFVVERHRWGGA